MMIEISGSESNSVSEVITLNGYNNMNTQ